MALVIRKEQLRAFNEAREAAFVGDLEVFVRRHFPAVAGAQSGASLALALRAEVARARTFGVEERAALAQYVCLGATLGWGFDRAEEHAWIVALLGDASIASPSHRVRLAVQGLATRLEREEARRVAEQRFEAACLAVKERRAT